MLRRYLFECIGIFLLSLTVALVTNYFRSDGLPLIRPEPAPAGLTTEDNQEGIISLQVLNERFNKPGVILLDARSPEEFKEGHIPWSRNLPYYEFAGKSSQFFKETSFDQEIITYCGGMECSNAEDLALLLREKGYKNVKVFEGGWEEWTQNNLPVEKG